VRSALPPSQKSQVVGTIGLAVTAGAEEIARRTLPLALADRHRREAALVENLLTGAVQGDTGVAGRAATLEALMSGDVRVVVAGRDVEGTVWECRTCGYVSATPAERCPTCGAAFEGVALAQALPVLARRHGAALELVGPPASEHLRDGVGGVLRRPRGAVRSA
jgi:hypothetical protein